MASISVNNNVPKNLIDLLREKNMLIRQRSEQLWDTRSQVKISSTERFLLTRIHGGQPTISELSKDIDVTRQAVHKCLKSLREKGLVETRTRESNRREKYVFLTQEGKQCYAENMQMKQELENAIIQAIGADSVAQLKQILQSEWPV